MSTLKQTSSGDLDFSTHTLQLVTDPDVETAQLLANRFRMGRGEWEFDTRIGTPYYEAIFGQRTADLPLVESLFARIAAETPGVARVEQVTATLDARRVLRVDLKIRSQTGALLSGQVGEAFIVEIESQ